MSLLDPSSAKRLCLWTWVVWSGLPVLAEAEEILVVGTPVIATLTSTLTLTTTVEYRPSLVPGNSQYTLAGCYSPFSGDGGHIFGPGDHDAVSEDKLIPGDLTIETCLRGCGSLVPPKDEEGYIYVGLRNGSECRCSDQLPSDTHKLPNDNCMAPCPGDPRLSCGGRTNIAVYSLIAATSQAKHSTTTPTTTHEKTSSTSSTPTTDTKTTAPSEPFPSSATHGKPASAATVGAITGSLSGAVLLVACLFLCYRAHTRKKRVQDAHVKSMLDRHGGQERPVQSPIFTQADIHNQAVVGHLVIPGHEHGVNGKDGGGGGGGGIVGQDSSGSERNKNTAFYGDPIPNTPALELGEKFPPSASARRSSRTATWEDDSRSSIAILGRERSEEEEDATSSAVHWRRPRNPSSASDISQQLGMTSSSTSISTPHKRTKSSSSSSHNLLIQQPPPPAARVDGLGERAWHRRKLSTPYQPAAAGVGIGVGGIARAGAPSGPPPGILPPAPPARPMPPVVQSVTRARSQPRAPETVTRDPSIRKPLPPAPRPPPPRPQRSFDTIDFPPELGEELEDFNYAAAPDILRPGAGGGGTGVSEWSPLTGSTPSLGPRYGYNSQKESPRPARTESPVLGWRAPTRDKGPPRTPVLPPVAPGERFDHRRWDGTSYAGERGRSSQSQAREGQGEGDDRSPLSASSTGTSILFGLEEFNRKL